MQRALRLGKFQSTLPRRERRFWLFFYVYFSTNFNPRSREGSDAMPLIQCLHRNISIHAPAKGATFMRHWKESFPSAFQSTLPRRERLSAYAEGIAAGKISIHAPAKGATGIRNHYKSKYDISIHAPAKGATKIIRTASEFMQFQSTLPRRERPKP